MKALIKSGLLVALGWLANTAHPQEVQWRAAAPKNPNPATVVPALANPASAGAGVRAVSVGQPTRLEDPSGSANPAGVIVRGQAADDKPAPLPKLEIAVGEPKPAKPMPKDNGFPPPPTPAPPPSPVFGSLGFADDGCCTDTCGTRFHKAGWSSGVSGIWGKGWGDGCCPDRARFWFNAEYLMWWQRAISVPPLVTASSGTGTDQGLLGDPRTMVLFDSIPNNTRSGGRFTAGMWLPHFCNVGVEVRYFFLTQQNTSATFVSDGVPQLTRPFFDTELMTQGVELASPGSVNIQSYSKLWGIEGNIRHKWHCGPNYWVDFLWGYRHLSLSEGIQITEDSTFTFAGDRLRVVEEESFRTRTQFNGMQTGLDSEWRLGGRCFLGVSARVALGTSHQIINIDGNTTLYTPTGNSSVRGALLAGQTNIGQFTANRFAVLPEVGLKVGVDITDHLRIYAGYDFLYLSSAIRPGDQIDLNVNSSFRPFLDPGPPTQVKPGVGMGNRLPMVPYRTSDYWAQGFNFGLQYRY